MRFGRKRNFAVRVDGTEYMVNTHRMSVLEIARLDPRFSGPDEWAINAKWPGGKRTRMAWDLEINLIQTPIERFELIRLQAQQG